MTSDNGTPLDIVKYEPYGSTRSGSVPTDRLFTGQRYDDTGLYYYGARYYDPEIGRFISPDTIVPDPMNPQSFNRYSYCLNNPLKYIDPSGHSGEAEDTLRLVVKGAGALSIPGLGWIIGGVVVGITVIILVEDETVFFSSLGESILNGCDEFCEDWNEWTSEATAPLLSNKQPKTEIKPIPRTVPFTPTECNLWPNGSGPEDLGILTKIAAGVMASSMLLQAITNKTTENENGSLDVTVAPESPAPEETLSAYPFINGYYLVNLGDGNLEVFSPEEISMLIEYGVSINIVHE